MIKKLFSSIRFSLIKSTKKYYTSKLYIPYNRTSEIYVPVEPYVDLENSLNNVKTLKDNIILRGLNGINLDKICNNWVKFVTARDELLDLNAEKQRLTVQLKKTKKDNSDEINRLQMSRSKVMTRLKILRDDISVLEKEVVIPSLSIPNRLHPECPLSEKKIVFQHNNRTKSDNIHGIGHIEIGKALDCLDYKNAVIVYLKNEASLCEQATMSYFNESLEQLDFVSFCNSDLIKSVIVEGCGMDIYNGDKTLILNEKNLHLVGGASLQSFCAFLTKQSVGGNKLPLKLYTAGRLYKPSNDDGGLFSAVQSNVVELLIGSTDEYKVKEQFDETLAVYKRLYDEIGLDYRIVYSPVSMLENFESLRAQVELYSINRREYVAVGSLSLSGDFISKRLRIHWSSKNKQNFMHIVSGKIVDINILLGCLLELNVNKFTVPDCLKSYMIL